MSFLRHKGLSAHRRHNILTAIKSFYSWCERSSVCPNHAQLVQFPKKQTKIIETYMDAEISAILSVLGPRDRLLFSLFLATGLRRHEMASLEVSDVCLSSRVIRIRHAKMGRERHVPIPAHLHDDLIAYVASLNCTTLWGISEHRMWHIWKAACDNVGVRARGIHAMRHTWACNMLLQGMTPLDLMYLGGWTSLIMVDRYSRAVAADTAIHNYHKNVIMASPKGVPHVETCIADAARDPAVLQRLGR